ncbi:peptide/nickel transport system ATP-binding protein/oligopeptide transport system ATP-binding protein [Palleronia aestuarii]|uniref:Peptide/nickel transport system ATP-binding protein/oligopeptide transport system ATP-binding protein n=1 Tax=Palleronia aestuarii TaxID=568105 RepID=A0A2W7N0L9_9RHOB|nr:ABC transporter ATP-binding protein [Palleronia aestuarii]PZX13668.1 peptide/nickel transport system ATP-binding protein/oligopeptide transport system ATP-binding protein [Palleronia aestuarii]
MSDPILEIRDLRKTYRIKRGGAWREIHAIDGVSLTVRRGETLGIVGESGCGKSTLGRAILRLTEPDGGQLVHEGSDLLSLGRRGLAAARLKIRMVFQDPYASLNPRRSVGDSVAELGDIHGLFRSRRERAERVGEALDRVGLGARFAASFPHELSGGQRQRVGLARAILPEPDLIIADEPVSALDVSIQAQVLNLLAELKSRLDLTLIFISHDLGVVASISDRVAVLYMGRVAEIAPADDLFEAPLHPYTRLLLSAIPRPDPSQRITGAVDLGEPPRRLETTLGCPFRDRCEHATARCHDETPPLREIAAGRHVACHHARLGPEW